MEGLRERFRSDRHCWMRHAMRDELCHALHEALYELEVLPEDEDAAVTALYAIMDDLRSALDRTQALDTPRLV